MKDYKNQLNKIRELKKARNVDLFATEVKRMAKQINQRFYRLEKRGLVNDVAYRYAQRETGKEKPRYSTNIDKLKDLSIQELYESAIEINAKLVSPTSTVRGLQKLEDVRLEASSSKLAEFGIYLTKEEIKDFVNKGGSELLNRRWLESFQIMEDWQDAKENGLTVKEFIRSYKAEEKRQIKKGEDEFDYASVRRRLKGVAERKAERRRQRQQRRRK